MEQNGIRLKLIHDQSQIVGFINSNTPIEGLFANCKSNIAFQIIIDTSGSMRRYLGNIRKSLIEFIQFIGSGVSYLPSGVKIYLNIVHFNTDHEQVFPKFETEADHGFGEIDVNTYKVISDTFPKYSTGYTHMFSALKTCQEKIWNKLPGNTILHKMILTDGQPNDLQSADTAYHNHSDEVWAKQQISLGFVNCIDTVVAIGSAGNYDYEFLGKMTNMAPHVAVSNTEILDTIRMAFFDIASKDFPKDCVLSIPKELIHEPECDVKSWSEQDDFYQLQLGQIGFGYQLTFHFKTHEKLEAVPFMLDYEYGDKKCWKDMIPVQEPTTLELHQTHIHSIKNQIKHLPTRVGTSLTTEEVESRFKHLKELERKIRLYASDPAISDNEVIQGEWKEQLNTILQLQCFLEQYDEDSYDLYTSTRSTSYYNTSLLRTMSSRPLDARQPSMIAGPVHYTCAVCMEQIDQDETILYDCSHMFCLGCAVTHYISGGRDCPKCRSGNVVNPAKMKKLIFPSDPTNIKKCLSSDCQNRYHGFNYPCMHVTSCQPCGNELKGTACPFPKCGHEVKKYVYYYTDYDQVS